MLDIQLSGQVLIRTHGVIGRITLNRPKALNALTQPMMSDIAAALDAWQGDPTVALLLLDGAGERGLCAGGDITIVRESALGDHRVAAALWRQEYQLDLRLARFGKPIVAVMDGVTMGGGVGLAGRAASRIVTERSRVAMPEVLIGLTPDCGVLDLLARAPGQLGTHVALTAAHLGAADALACGLADVFVPSTELPALLATLCQDGLGALGGRAEPPPGELAGAREWIDECYVGDDPVRIVHRLAAHPAPAARAAAERISALSPTAVAVTLRAIRQAEAEPGLEPCLVRDYRLIRRFLEHPDLVEGITARVVDRTHTPRWTPPTLAEVRPEDVAAFFAPLGAEELELPDT